MPSLRSRHSTTRRFALPIGRAVALLGTILGTMWGTLGMPPRCDADEPDFPGVTSVEFVYEQAPFPECHASTLAQTPGGLVAAWFGGAKEGTPDVGIWVARRTDAGWSEPVEIANGIQYREVDGTPVRYPCWNPVLFQVPDGPLQCFYKAGPSPSAWWGMLTESDDGGETWSRPIRLPEGILGPIKNKPILLGDGKTLLCPSSTEHAGWRVHMELLDLNANDWTRSAPLNSSDGPQAIQPTLLDHGDGKLQALCRDRNGEGSILSTRSDDGGRSWSALTPLALANPNSGIDAVTLDDGRHLLVYNPTRRGGPSPRGREKLSVAISENGDDWTDVGTLENEAGAEFSYPAVIQRADGTVVLSYTWKRDRIRVVTLDPTKFSAPR